MILESSDNYEARNMPGSVHTQYQSNFKHQSKRAWLAEMDREHDRRWETDPEYRQNCIENEVEFKRRKEKDLHY